MAEHADLIIENGRLITFDGANGLASAIAVKGDKILAAGSDEDVAISKVPAPDASMHKGAQFCPASSKVTFICSQAVLNLARSTCSTSTAPRSWQRLRTGSGKSTRTTI